MSRILVLTTTTGYQTRSFGDAAGQLGIELVFATDRCHQLDDPWRDRAIAIRFHDEEASVRAILDAVRLHPIDGLLVLGDRPTVIGARVAAALSLPGNPVKAAAISRNKLAMREAMARAGLPAPWFHTIPLDADPRAIAKQVSFPCVVKPLALSGSRGVMRADNAGELAEAIDRLRRLLRQPDVRVMRDGANERILVEGFVSGREFAVEGILEHGRFRTLAIFDKPDPLDGPFFEETIYVTPPASGSDDQRRVISAVVASAAALGLHHGPVHAECRLNGLEAVVLEIAARPIGGLCARALRFVGADQSSISLEELLLRHARGEASDQFTRERAASAVMMIPIPRGGTYRGLEGLEEGLAVPGVTEIDITAKLDQTVVPLPEGASYLGFIFARADRAADAEHAIRTAHQRLRFSIAPIVPMLRNG